MSKSRSVTRACERCKGTNCIASPFRDLPYGAICRNPDHKCPDCVDGKKQV